jgi:hypothetical protein
VTKNNQELLSPGKILKGTLAYRNEKMMIRSDGAQENIDESEG